MAQDSWDRLGGIALSAVRIVVSFMFILHGISALFGVLGAPYPAPLFAWPSWWAGLIQFVGGVLVLLGLFTRPAALVCSGAMAFAYFSVHQPKGLLPLQNGGVSAALYAWFFLLIAILGGGPYALDTLLRQIRQAPPRTRAHTGAQ
ncbi:DoxX family protein [Saccharopolyspora phatthalungensis]|uniref:Putative oxidoreductase n=1 Tax=Saccharopolyspora phatthalungensis TaxID=664693 RepID=A0A840Q345_9PSEU|nr:DoxX family protein [Saccharopolyspora phatthalungensis]MBB5153129.1 putative oxidoreductase [Saccharopolyspora phatthalungensis]